VSLPKIIGGGLEGGDSSKKSIQIKLEMDWKSSFTTRHQQQKEGDLP